MTDLRNISLVEENPDIDEETRNRELLTIFHHWINSAETSTPEGIWRDCAAEDYKFYAGKQDSVGVLAKLAAELRPNSTFNEIKPKIDTLIGLAAQLKLDPSILPVEDTDEALAEPIQTAFKYFRRKLKLDETELECFEHTAKAGRSLHGYFIDSSNPFEPRIRSRRVESGRYWLDPDSRDYPEMEDARFLVVDNWLDVDDVNAFYPNFNVTLSQTVSTIDSSLQPSLVYFDEMNQKIRVVEIWYRVYEQTAWFVNPLTGQPDSLPLKNWPAYVQALTVDGIPDGNGGEIKLEEPPEMVAQPKKIVKYAIVSGDQILERGDNPYEGYNKDKFPYSLYAGYRDDESDVWFGATTMMKDPQRGLNTVMRQLIHLLNNSPKNMLVHEDGAVLDIEEYKNRGSSANFDLKVQKGAVSGNKIKFTDQPTIPAIYQDLLTRYSELMKNLSGVQDVFLGIAAGSREPGITSQLRQQSGIAVLFVLFENFRRARIHGGNQLLSLIQQFVTSTQFLRIDPVSEPFVINGQRPDGSILNDMSVGKFDLMVEEALEGSSMKLANAKILTEFAQNNPGAIPADVLLDQTSVSSSAKQRIREFQAQQQESQIRDAEENLDLEWAKILEKADKAITPENVQDARKNANRKRKTFERNQ